MLGSTKLENKKEQNKTFNCGLLDTNYQELERITETRIIYPNYEIYQNTLA